VGFGEGQPTMLDKNTKTVSDFTLDKRVLNTFKIRKILATS
jgi:hypothetical protein